ncbi:hypothetical protein PG996_013958 [Apiospora saccharicola]|uniref:TauD/TfdA-like domain-containing protein n=1 Tax=Apiospora saccharicola TaxID=335842 RepID=A0ABR1TGY8_9PEZI
MATQTFSLSSPSLTFGRDQVELEHTQNLPRPALTANFPSQIHGPTAWSGLDSDVNQPVHILELSEHDVAVVETALERFKGLGMHGDQVSREFFPLPGLESRLDRCALEIHNGTGICVIRGIESKYSVEDYLTIYLGISSYIGNRRGLQDAKGSMLSHVTDSKTWTVPLEQRHGIHTNYGLPHHCDMGSDILSLHIRKTAAIGGRLCVASSHTVYNELARSDPSALRTLMEPNWPVQASLRQKPPYTLSPLFEYYQGNLIFSMDPARLGPLASAPRTAAASKLPPLTAAQLHALGRVQQAARQHEICLESEPGDMVYLNSWSTLHARQPYQDGETFSRHLVRMWLRNDMLGWPVPDSMRMPWDSTYGAPSDRIINRRYPVVPMPIYMEPRYHNTTAAFVPDDDDDDGEDEGDVGEMAAGDGINASLASPTVTNTTPATADGESSIEAAVAEDAP